MEDNILTGIIPIVGTYLDIKRFYNNPTWENAGWAVISGLGDILTFTGVGAGFKALKAARALNRTRKALEGKRATKLLESRKRFSNARANNSLGTNRSELKSANQSLVLANKNYLLAKAKNELLLRYYRDIRNGELLKFGKNLGQDMGINTLEEIRFNPDLIGFNKNGSKIHIKEKNKGKFTDYCGGKVTDECIRRGKNSKNPKIRKRATFAANSRTWSHEEGSKIHKPFGHRSILDNGWRTTKLLKDKKIPIGLNGIPGIDFRDRAARELSRMKRGLDRVEASELNDSIQAKKSFIEKTPNYKTALSKPNVTFYSAKSLGLYPLDKDPLYFDGFDSNMAKLIYTYGKSRGLSDNLLATIIEAGWRESNLGAKTNSAAHGIWQFDKKAGTYDKYTKWRGNRPDNWKSLFDYLITEYMPSRDDGVNRFGYKNIWSNPKSSLDELSKYFLMEVEAPRDKHQLLDRTKRAVKTIHSNLR